MSNKILSGHVSAETAHIDEDYPYGFRLRCKRRVWLETTKHGTRMVTQTSNPKKGAGRAVPASGLREGREGEALPVTEVWNKPKASTYTTIGVLYLDGEGLVQWTALSAYNADKAEAFAEEWSAGFTDRDRAVLALLIRIRDRRAGKSASPELGIAGGADEVALAASDDDVSEGAS